MTGAMVGGFIVGVVCFAAGLATGRRAGWNAALQLSLDLLQREYAKAKSAKLRPQDPQP